MLVVKNPQEKQEIQVWSQEISVLDCFWLWVLDNSMRRRSLDFLSKNLGAFQVAQWSRVCLTMRDTQETQIWSLGWKLLWGRKWQPASVFLLGESHGEEPGGLQFMWSWQGHKESDMTEHIHILVKFFTVRRWKPQGQASHPCLNRDQGQGADPWLRDASCYSSLTFIKEGIFFS